MILGEDKWLLFTGRHFWNRKCRKKMWWQQEFAVASHLNTANSCCHHVFLRHFRFQKCLPVNSNFGGFFFSNSCEKTGDTV